MPNRIDGSEEDRALIRAVVAGEPGAREDFARRYRPWILGLASSRFRLHGADADDLFQDVMVRLWEQDLRALRTWRGEGRFSTYLTVITCRLGLARARAKAKAAEQTASDEPDSEEPSSDEPASKDTSADDELLAKERASAVRGALARLSGRDRLVLMLRARDGRSFDEIGAILGLRPATARKAAFDARKRLRELLAENFDDLFAEEIER